MSEEKDQDKAKLNALKKSLKDIEQRLSVEGDNSTPASIKHLEKRMQSLQQELAGLHSEKMLAYKLQRLAQSKLLSDVQDQLSTPSKKTPKPRAKAAITQANPAQDKQYLSSTFKCKSDLDLCLLDCKSALGKALCYTLFIRCMLKG